MATPRKHWFRVADSIGREPWSNDVVATFLRLLAHLNTRWARDGLSAEEGCRCVLSAGHAAIIAGANSFPLAVERLQALAEAVSIEIAVEGRVPIVYFVQRSDGLIKIGQTANWPSRKNVLERECGSLKFISAIVNVDGRKLEKRIHRELSADRVEGDWFTDTPAVREWADRGAFTEQELTARALYQGQPTVRVFWPKWAYFQGVASRSSPSDAPESPPPQDAPARRSRKTKNPPTPRAAARDGARSEEGSAGGAAPTVSARVDAVWPSVVAAMSAYGKKVSATPPRSGSAARKLLETTVRTLGDDGPIRAVHGFARYHAAKTADDAFDPRAYLRVETVFGAKRDKYVDVYREAVEAGESPPFAVAWDRSRAEIEAASGARAGTIGDRRVAAARASLEALSRAREGRE